MKINDYTTLFKALSEPVRLRILYLLLEQGELCVCDLVEALALSQSVVSRHLAYLRNSGLLLTRREGVWMYYQVDHAHSFSALLLTQFRDSARESTELADDLRRHRIATLDRASCN